MMSSDGWFAAIFREREGEKVGDTFNFTRTAILNIFMERTAVRKVRRVCVIASIIMITKHAYLEAILPLHTDNGPLETRGLISPHANPGNFAARGRSSCNPRGKTSGNEMLGNIGK
jgi:hypothetical protein